jgi:hypothetical protein
MVILSAMEKSPIRTKPSNSKEHGNKTTSHLQAYSNFMAIV